MHSEIIMQIDRLQHNVILENTNNKKIITLALRIIIIIFY